MKRAWLWITRCALAVAVCFSPIALSISLDELESSGHLHIDSSLAPTGSIVPGQKVTLTLEVATDRWFTGGTRIGIPEVPGLVILQTEQFASNASESRNGQTWVIQRWTLDVFPQRAGDFTVGPIPVQLQVNAGEDGDAKGELLSPSLQFSVTVPAILEQISQWVAAPTFSVSQRFDKDLENLKVGDAFEQEILFEASDVLAMMLPTYEVEQQAGLAAYPSPVELDNSANRGQTLASRRLRISYVVEQAGQFVLPAREYYWWNTQNSELELLSVPETGIAIAGAAPAGEAAATPLKFKPGQLLVIFLGLIVLAVIVRVAMIYLPHLPWARATEALSNLASRWRAMRKPALAARLNPGSSAED